MKKILIITNMQFGYVTDTLKYCEYLGELYNIEVVSVDNDFPRVVKENVQVHYVKNKNKYLKRLEFLKIVKGVAKDLKPDIIFVDYFIGCSLIKLLLGNKYTYNLDLRTGAISKNKTLRRVKNILIKLECYAFKNISIVSKSLEEHLGINRKSVHVLPLGADRNNIKKNAVIKDKAYKNINLIYVGTLFERNIEQTIIGFSNYLDKYSNRAIDITYDIIGFSKNLSEVSKIENYIKDLNLSELVKFHGKLEYRVALDFISKANIGISYIPITEYFNFQPPTKTFEYLLSGIPCLATSTFENAKIINSTNGMLIKDSPDSFCEGLNNMINNFNSYKEEEIVNSVTRFTWENIIFNNLEPYLKGIFK